MLKQESAQVRHCSRPGSYLPIPLMQASGNVAGLCNWAEAMCTYHNVAKVVEPKIEALRAAEAQLKIATREKDAALEQLVVVQTKLDAMQASHTCNFTHLL